METLFIYLLKASAGMVLFYIVYWLFLRKETFYGANRWFLVASLISSIILPLFPLQYNVLIVPEQNTTIIETLSNTFKNIQPENSGTVESGTGFNWIFGILLIYVTGAAIFLIRLLTQTVILLHLVVKYKVKSLEGIRIVENEKYGLPFSFFNIVFINPKFHKQENLPEILAHEKVHIRENHWFDLLLIELLTVIFWFNPFIWFFERSIKQNHEYLADEGVLAQGHEVGGYQALLVNQLMGMQIIGVTNNLNFALNTNRLKMMTKKKTSRIGGIRFVWTLPVLALLLFAFAEPSYRIRDINPDDQTVSIRELDADVIKLVGFVLDENGEALPGASVVIKGTTVGTVTDKKGQFKIALSENDNLVISFVGKATLVQSASGIATSNKNDGAYYKKFRMKEGVIHLDLKEMANEIPPPPPPPKVKKGTPAPPPPPGKETSKKAKSEKEVFYVVESLPVYPGGNPALANTIMKKAQKYATVKKIKGKAHIGFTVSAKGNVTNVKVLKKSNDTAAKAAVAIVSELDTWKPGTQRGKPVSVNYTVPIEF